MAKQVKTFGSGKDVFIPSDELFDPHYEVHGGGGDDVVHTWDGNDVLYGDDGNDVLITGTGDDMAYGGKGDDKISVGDFKLLPFFRLQAWGGEGNDQIWGYKGDDKLYGEAGNDVIEAGEGSDQVKGGFGNDYLDAGYDTVKDTLWGGFGDDTFRIRPGDVVYEDPTAGTDTILAARGATYGEKAFADTWVENFVVDDELYYSNDWTWIHGNGLNNIMTGGAYGDILDGMNGNDTINGNGGRDMLGGGLGADTIDGGDGDDSIDGDLGGSMDDYVASHGADVADRLYGGKGNDGITGGNGNDSLFGQDGDDWLNGGDDNDYIVGGAGKDEIRGEDGNDDIHGDVLDTLIGGAGNDTYTLTGQAKIVEKAGEGIDTVRVYAEGTFVMSANIENMSFHKDDLSQNAVGNALANVIKGSHAYSSLEGGAGNDTIYGDNPDVINTGAGSVNFLYGDAGNDILYGGKVGDVMHGGADQDHLWGASGSDLLYGDDGNDKLYGEHGNDKLQGGGGQDRLEGGAGSDSFVFKALSDSAVATYDKIVGFEFGSDKIDLSGIDANTTQAGNQAFSFYGMEAPVFGSPGVVWAEQSGAGIKILADVDGDLNADFMTVVFGIDVWNSTFQSSDFIL